MSITFSNCYENHKNILPNEKSKHIQDSIRRKNIQDSIRNERIQDSIKLQQLRNEHLCFKGIPITGSVDFFEKELAKVGFIRDNIIPNRSVSPPPSITDKQRYEYEYAYSGGTYASFKAEILLYITHISRTVYKIIVRFPDGSNPHSIGNALIEMGFVLDKKNNIDFDFDIDIYLEQLRKGKVSELYRRFSEYSYYHNNNYISNLGTINYHSYHKIITKGIDLELKYPISEMTFVDKKGKELYDTEFVEFNKRKREAQNREAFNDM